MNKRGFIVVSSVLVVTLIAAGFILTHDSLPSSSKFTAPVKNKTISSKEIKNSSPAQQSPYQEGIDSYALQESWDEMINKLPEDEQILAREAKKILKH